MNIKRKAAGWDPAASVDAKYTAHNYQQYNIGIEHLFLCGSILTRIGEANA